MLQVFLHIVTIMKRTLLIGTVLALLGCSTGSPLLNWVKKDGDTFLGKVSTIKQTVYEKKREFLNGVNEHVSKLLWIPPWPSSTTEEIPVNIFPQHDPVPETPGRWWWQTTEQPHTITIPTTAPSPSTTMRYQSNDDRLVFTVPDTNELEQPNVFMYARSSFIPQEQRLTDSTEYAGPIMGRGPPVPNHLSDRLVVV